MSKSLDLNCDVGEISSELDRAILPWVSSCNVSCGAHAGDNDLIRGTIAEAIKLGVAIGAHPSYPDRANFGRQSMDLSPVKLSEAIRNQIDVVHEIVLSLGGVLRHVKPHGALYNDMVKDEQIAIAVIDTIRHFDDSLVIYGQANSFMAEICAERELHFVHEVFADRRYEDQANLRSRIHVDSVIDDPVDFQSQLDQFLSGCVVDVQKRTHSIFAQTICLHSDTPRATEFAKLANKHLKENDVRIAAP